MHLSRDELHERFPGAWQLFHLFGQDYADEFDANERRAVDEYIWGCRLWVPKTIHDLNGLLDLFRDDVDLRRAVLDLGVSYTIWDEQNEWRAFVVRLRDWLVESLGDPESGRPMHQDQANLVEVLRRLTNGGSEVPDVLRRPALTRTGEYFEPPEADPVPGALDEVERLLGSEYSDDWLRGLFAEFGFSYEDESEGAMRVLLGHLRDMLRAAGATGPHEDRS